jgi:hypothetical protein
MPCVFCGGLGLSKQHVLGQWLENITHEPRSVRRRGNTPSKRREPKLYQEQVRVVCQDRCNGGWMGRIEEAAIPAVSELVRRQPGDLPPQGQIVVARWAALTALMSCYLQPQRRVPRDYPSMFYALKEPPEVTVVWLATYDMRGGQAESYRRAELVLASNLIDPTGTIGANEVEGYVVTMNVWHLAFKVVVLKPNEGWTNRPTRLQIKLDRTIPGVLPIWPISVARNIGWPITPEIDDLSLSALANAKPVVTARQ